MKRRLFAIAIAFSFLTVALGAADQYPFVGRWGLTTPAGQAGWLGIDEDKDGELSANILWGRGSVLPAQKVSVQDRVLTIQCSVPKNNGDAQQTLTVTLAKVGLTVRSLTLSDKGVEIEKGLSHAKRLAPLPPRPDLSKVTFGEPINLIAASSLDGWIIAEKDAPHGWSVKDGILSNRVTKIKGQRFGNLRTTAEFEDFKLTTEVRALPESNSGIYLRGVYEIQMAETFGKPLDSHNMGALYSRITPAIAAEKPAGEWQTVELTLVDHHITVVLNGQTVIDNEPAMGCTGGALTSDDSLPGPILLQGDHSDIDYRKMVLRPVKK